MFIIFDQRELVPNININIWKSYQILHGPKSLRVISTGKRCGTSPGHSVLNNWQRLQLDHHVGSYRRSRSFFLHSVNQLIIINENTKSPKSNKNTNMYLDHLATTTNISTSWRRAAVLAPPSLEPDKTYRSRSCCNRQTRSHRAKAP
jgi:hypothetical protein